MTARQLEISKYTSAYGDSRYAMGRKRHAAVAQLVKQFAAGSWLDVGTGRGETLTLAAAAGHGPVRGTEVVPYLLNPLVTYAEAHALPFADREFDYVSCLDVLEHLTEADIVPALRELKRVAKRMCIVTAADFPHYFKGVDLHISQRPIDEWDALIRGVWGEGVQYNDRLGISASWRLDVYAH